MKRLVLPLKYGNAICGHSKGEYKEELYTGTVYCALQDGSNFKSADEILRWDIKMKATEQCFPAVCFILLHKLFIVCND